jgi:hypothetical protein
MFGDLVQPAKNHWLTGIQADKLSVLRQKACLLLFRTRLNWVNFANCTIQNSNQPDGKKKKIK